jgi:hypothetical protein
MKEIPDVLDFNELETIEVPVKYKKKEYVLVEASGEAVVKYRNKMSKCAKLSSGGKVAEVTDLASVEPYLVSLCLFEIDGDKRKPVSVQTVEKFENRVMKKLYETAKRISNIDEDEETKENLETKKKEIEERLEELANKDEETKNASSDTRAG